MFTELSIRLPVTVYGVLTTLVNSNQILIAGGYSEENQEQNKAYTINVSNGSIKHLPPLSRKCWSILPIFYLKENSSFEIFHTSEETDEQMPENISYTLKLPIN